MQPCPHFTMEPKHKEINDDTVKSGHFLSSSQYSKYFKIRIDGKKN